MEKHFETPSAEEIKDFLFRLAVGSEGSYLDAAIHSAYGDLCRTLRGIARNNSAQRLREEASELLHHEIEKAVSLRTQTEFDEWHEGTCAALMAIYRNGGFSSFRLGQAQKWVNMSVKYCALLEDRALPGGSSFFKVAHMPIDSVIVRALTARYDLPKAFQFYAWSQINDYGEYMKFQEWIRKTFRDSSPLAAEFYLWRDEISGTGAALTGRSVSAVPA